MKALSIRMPWAYLCARGIKKIENRSWNTSFRGKFYIHAGQRFDMPALDSWRLKLKKNGGLIDEQTGIHIAWLVLLWDRGFSGIIGEANLVKVATTSSSPWFEGPFGYCLADAKLYRRFIPCKGRLGFFELDLSGAEGVDIEEWQMSAEEVAKAKKGKQVTCRYCNTTFTHSGKLEFQTCPRCLAELLI